MVEGVVGLVTGTDSRPIANALIEPKALDPESPPIPELAIVSTVDGRYEWPLSAGPYELSALAPSYRQATGTVVVIPGQVATLDFALERKQ